MGRLVNATLRSRSPWERPVFHFIGPRAGLDGYEKSRPPPEFDIRTDQLVASLYTD
jgi:hypothetical protein